MRCTRSALAAALAALAWACAEAPTPEALSGAVVLGERAQLASLLASLSELEGTPLGRRSAQLALALPDCDSVAAHSAEPDLAALLADLHCFDPEGPLAALGSARGEHGVALRWPLGGGASLQAWVDVDAQGGARASLRLPTRAASGAALLLLPGEEPPGPALLSGDTSLLHARLRPAGGLDLASLVPRGGQGDRMFRLKSELFRGVALDGTWEAALYVPGPGEPVPRAALALGFTQRAAAVAGLEAFIASLRETWPLRRSFFSHTGAEGACLLDLRILPGFAPCYVATAEALVLGYNPESLRTALGDAGTKLGDAASEPGGVGAGLGNAGGLLVELARFDEADALLAAPAGPDGEPGPESGRTHSPWSRLRAEARSDSEQLQVQLRLDPRRGA